MSTAEILSLISTIAFVVAGISFVLAAFFWFFFKIPTVIGDLSGRTAQKSIARMRASNERMGGKGYKSSTTNANRGKLTDTMRQPRKLEAVSNRSGSELSPTEGGEMPETGLLSTNKVSAVDTQQTALLGGDEATGMLDGNDATGLLLDDETTAVLYTETQRVERTSGTKVTMLEDIMLIHTDEVID